MPTAAPCPTARPLYPPPRPNPPRTLVAAPVPRYTAEDHYAAAPPRHARTPSLPHNMLPLVPFSDVALELGRPCPPPWQEPAPPAEWRYRIKMGICALLVMGVPVAVVYLSIRAMRKASR